MNKKRFLAALAVATLAFSMVGCGSSGGGDSKGSDSGVAKKDKPLCWFNRQPSNSSTGELDKEALSFNDDTYYVGFDANQGAELQGTMIRDYIEANIDTIDRNGDGVIGYVLAVGDKVSVKLMEIDKQGRLNFSMKDAMEAEENK